MQRFVPLPKTLAFAAAAALLIGCGDDVTDPQAMLDSAEAEAVLRSAAALPALPILIQGAGELQAPADRLALFRAQELWAAGTAGPENTGRAQRRLAVRYAAPVLASRLDPAEWDRVEAGLLDWITTAGSMLRHIELPAVEDRLRTARSFVARAASASAPEARASALLLAGAELVETTPRFVARTLAAEAEVAVSRAVADGAPEEPRLERAVRLKDWAAQAVEAGDYLLAVQRAYYAIQLVEPR